MKNQCLNITVSKIVIIHNIIIELPDTKCVLIANHTIDQYTHYNMPSAYEKASDE